MSKTGFFAGCRGVFALFATGCASLLAACDRQKVEVYQVPKQAVSFQSAAGLVPPPATQPVSWKKPEGWQEKPLTEMRQASFQIPSPNGSPADVSVTSFPGMAGGIESNLNRWRGQVHLSPLTGAELDQTIEHRTVGGIPVLLVDMASPGGTPDRSRILGAIFESSDRTWFIKMTGDPDLLTAQKPEFESFVSSFRFANDRTESAPSENVGRPKSTNDK
jgi:hypothetical protein